MKKYLFNEIRDTKISLFWLLTPETRNFENWVQNSKLSLTWQLNKQAMKKKKKIENTELSKVPDKNL